MPATGAGTVCLDGDVENPYCLYPEELGRTFGDVMTGCTLQERAHYMACQRVILNFDLATIRRCIGEVKRILTRNYGPGLLGEPHADVKTLERLRSIETQHIAKSAHVDRLDWYLGTTGMDYSMPPQAVQTHDFPGYGREVDSELPRQLPLPLRLVDMNTVNTARMEGTAPQSPYGDSGLGNTLPISALQTSHASNQQLSIGEPERSTIPSQNHRAVEFQPSNEQREIYGLFASSVPTARSTCGDWESDSDCVPIPTETSRVQGLPVREVALFADLGGPDLSAVSDRINANEHSSVNEPTCVTKSPVSTRGGNVIQHPGYSLLATCKKTSTLQYVPVGGERSNCHQPRIPLVFKHGIQYVPKIPSNYPQARQSSYECHAVVLSSIPEEARMRDVLPRVRGGKIVRASLINTMAHGMGLTVFVTFSDWRDAHGYTSFAKRNPDLMIVLGRRVTVQLANTPTYPSRCIQNGQNNNLSRCLEFRLSQGKCHQELLKYIQTRFKNIRESLEDAWVSQPSVVVFLFRNIEDAIRVHGIIGLCHQYKDERDGLGFGHDPCREGLGYLQHPACLARGDCPSIIDEWIDENGQNRSQGTIDALKLASVVTKRGSANHQSKDLAGDDDIHAIGVFKSEGESWKDLESYSMDQYGNKYGYSEYIESPDEWLEAWPYVGNLKRVKPRRNDEVRIRKAPLPNDNTPLQRLINRGDYTQIQEHEMVVASIKGAASIKAAALRVENFTGEEAEYLSSRGEGEGLPTIQRDPQ